MSLSCRSLEVVHRCLMLCLLLSPSAVWSAEIQEGLGLGQKIYYESFADVTSVDAAAGGTGGLDQTFIEGAGALRQITSLSDIVTSDFDLDPTAYSFDATQIELSNGQVQLRPDPLWPKVRAYWRLEASNWGGVAGEVIDSAASGIHGMALGDAQTTVNGWLQRGASFDGAGDAVVLGQPTALDLDPASEFTLSTWFRTTGDGALIAKADGNFGDRQFYLFVAGGRLWGAVGGQQHQGLSSGVSDGQWHHAALVNRNEGGTLRFTLYLDGVADGTFDSGTVSNASDLLLGARRQAGNSGLAFELAGNLDEVVIFDAALSDSDVTDLYASGSGRVLAEYPTTGPALTEAVGHSIFNGSGLTGFQVTPSSNNQGSLGFQLSNDGQVWQTWDGIAWVEALGSSATDASTVDINIAAFDLSSEALYLRTFLISDGSQPVGIDHLAVTFDRAPVFEAREILGPITASQGFDHLQATTLDVDAGHAVRIRVLEADAETSVGETLLPGNGNGFDSSQLASPGVDLSQLSAGSIYLEVVFENLLGDGDSAGLDSFQVAYDDAVPGADVHLTLASANHPLVSGDVVDYSLSLSNPTADPLLDPTLEITLPNELSLLSLTPPSGWSCDLGGAGCESDLLAGGESVEVILQLEVATVIQTTLTTLTLTASGRNDASAENDRTHRQLTLDPSVPAQLEILQDSEPADGTDFVYDLTTDVLSQVVLDDAQPDDGDAVTSDVLVLAGTGASIILTQQPTAGWVLDDVVCTSPQVISSFDQAWTVSSDCLFDPTAVALEDGLVRLLEDPLAEDVLSGWRFEESTWDGSAGEVVAISGPPGSALGDATTTEDGLLGRAATFDGNGDAVDLGQPEILDVDPTQPFTLSVWFRTLGDGALIAKADGDFNQRQFYLFVIGDRLWGTVGGSQHQGQSSGVSDGQWHHAALVNAEVGGVMQFTLYLDGVADGTFASGSARNDANVLLGARRDQGNEGLAFGLNGQLDETTVLGRDLSSLEIESLYQQGAGRVLGGYPNHGPAVSPVHFGVDRGFIAFTGFSEEVGPNHEGQLAYQVSTDGATWQWFDGSNWSVAGVDQYNDAASLDTHVASLALADPSQGVGVRAFLLSDGSQRVELDRIRLFYDADGLGGVTIAAAGLTVDGQLSPEAACVFQNVIDPSSFGSLTLVEASNPANGIDFEYVADLAGQTESFFLDDGGAVDAVESMRSWPQLEPGIHRVSHSVTTPGWYLSDISCGDPAGSFFTTSYDEATDYSYDDALLEVASGVVRLRLDPFFDDLLAYWRLDEASWSSGQVFDDSGQGLHGSAIGQATTLAGGVIGRAGHFGGGGDAVVLGQPSSLDLDPTSDEFTVSAWFRTSGDGAIIGKAEDAFGQRQVYLFVAGGQVHANVGGEQHAGSGGSFADGQWHHVALVNDISSGSPRFALYVDGTLRGEFASGSATNNADWMIGARRQSGNVGTAFALQGEVDEVAVLGRVLDAVDVASLYGQGDGRSLSAYPATGPSIVKTLGDGASFLRLQSFHAVQSAGEASNLAFQLSNDGIHWSYWNGFSWVPADDGQRNDENTVNLKIGLFDASSGQIFVRVFLLSDGSQANVLDSLLVGYDQIGSVSTDIEFNGGEITVDLQGGQQVLCVFSHEQDTDPSGSLTVVLNTFPASQTNIPFDVTHPDGSHDALLLDDAKPDDGDAYSNRVTLENVVGGVYAVEPSLPSGWSLSTQECVDELSHDSGFVTDYQEGAGFTFDTTKIEVSDGVARLIQDPLWDDILAYWRLEETSWNGSVGEVIDLSGLGHHGVASGGVEIGSGVLGQGGLFDGIDDHLSFGNPPALDLLPGSSAFTLSAWFKTTGNGAIVGKAGGNLAERQFYLFVLDDKLWSIVGGELHSSSTSGVTDGAWHHAAVVNFDAGGGAMRHALYLDGLLQGDFASGNATNNADLLIGARRADDSGGGLAFPLSGQVDEVLILGRELSSSEIQDLYADGSARRVDRYPSDAPAIEQIVPNVAEVLTFVGIHDAVGPEHTGDLAYQMDLGDGQWRFWDGSSWLVATHDGQRNQPFEMIEGLNTLTPNDLTSRVKAFLISDGSQQVEVEALHFFYHSGHSVDFTVVDDGVEVVIEPGRDVTCRFTSVPDVPLGTLTVVVDTQPADGTDVMFEHGTFDVLYLDDAMPDDGDAIGDSYTFSFETETSYNLQLLGADRWGIRSIVCAGNSSSETYDPEFQNLTVPVSLEEDVICTLSFEKWFHRTATMQAITSTTTAFIDHISASQEGERLLIAATGDPLGIDPQAANGTYLHATSTATWSLLESDHPDGSFSEPELSPNGLWAVLDRIVDPTSQDEDLEIRLFDLTEGTATQLTHSDGCYNVSPEVHDDGTKVTFLSNCYGDPTFDAQPVVLDDGVAFPIAAMSDICYSEEPAISNDPEGERVTFLSTCDWTGDNSDGGAEIFQWLWQDGASAVEQLTSTSEASGSYVASPEVSAEGRYVVLLTHRSEEDVVGLDQVKRLDRLTGETLSLQLASDGLVEAVAVPGNGDDPRQAMGIDSTARHIVFLGRSLDEPETTRWIWAEITEAEDVIFNDFAVGDVSSLFRDRTVRVVWDGTGLPEVYLISEGNFDGSNADGSEEIWHVTFE